MKFARAARLSAVSLVVLLCACVFPAHTQPAKDWAARLDAGAAKFTTAQASFHKDLYTKAVDDHNPQDGIIYAKRGGGATEVGIKIIGPGAQTILYKKGAATIFNPANGCVNTYEGGKAKGAIESLLALGFGASGKELNENWTVKDIGEDVPGDVKADKGVKLEELDLVPKDAGLRSNIKHVTLWTDLDTAVSYKQILYYPSGDTQTGVYSNIVLKKQPDTKPFEFKGKSCK